MGPKPKKDQQGKKAAEEDLVIVAEEATPEPVIVDPLDIYRYKNPPPTPGYPWKEPTTARVPVLKRSKQKRSLEGSLTSNKKRLPSGQEADVPWTTIPATAKEKEQIFKLDLDVLNPAPLSQWLSPGERPIEPPPIEVIKRAAGRGPGQAYKRSQKESLLKEMHSLENYEKMQRRQMVQEQHLISKTGKGRSQLLQRKHQVLPKIDTNGKEKEKFTLERPVTPKSFKLSSFFRMGHVNSKNGLNVTLTQKELGYDMVTDWLGCPYSTTPSIKMLGLVRDDLFISDREEAEPVQNNFIPEIRKLGLVAMDYHKTQRHIKVYAAIGDTAADGVSVKSISREPQSLPDQTNNTHKISEDLPPNNAFSRVGLVFGDVILEWTTDPERAKNKFTVEVGCSTELDKNGVASRNMTNIGTTAINFNWIKLHHRDTFQLNRYDIARFAFDSFGGVILPGETFRIPCLYKGFETGYFSEDWKFITKPVLENGAEVILRLWGFTRKSDPFTFDSKIVDQIMSSRMSKILVKQQVDKIINHLPLKEIPLKNTRFPIVYLGPDLFHLNNPGFYYNTTAVYMLSKLADLVSERNSAKRKKPSVLRQEEETRIHPSHDLEDDIDSSLSLVSATSILENEDEEEHRHVDRGASLSSSDHVSESLDLSDDELSIKKLDGTMSENIEALEKIIYQKINFNLSNLNAPESKNTPAATPIKVINETQQSLQAVGETQENTAEDAEAESGQAQRSPDFELEDDKTTEQAVPKKSEGDQLNDKEKILPEPAPSRKWPINLVNADITLENIRNQILQEDVLEVQEALFRVFSDQVSILSFRRDLAHGCGQLGIMRSYLCQAIDSFSDFAQILKYNCCVGQAIEEELVKKAAVVENSDDLSWYSDDGEENPQALPPKLPWSSEKSIPTTERRDSSKNNPDSDDVLEAGSFDEEQELENPEEKVPEEHPESEKILGETTIEDCPHAVPKKVLKESRYINVYYQGLYSRMFSLLGDFGDAIEQLWTLRKESSVQFGDQTFKTIRDIPMKRDVKAFMKGPMPPKWIKTQMAIEKARLSNKKRQEAV